GGRRAQLGRAPVRADGRDDVARTDDGVGGHELEDPAVDRRGHHGACGDRDHRGSSPQRVTPTASASTTVATSSGPPTVRTWTSGTVRLASPARTPPGPTSTSVRTPSVTRRSWTARQRTGASTPSTSAVATAAPSYSTSPVVPVTSGTAGSCTAREAIVS